MYQGSKYLSTTFENNYGSLLKRQSKDVGVLTPVFLKDIASTGNIKYLENLCAVCEQIRTNPIWYQKESQANKLKMLQIYQISLMYAANTNQIYLNRLEQQSAKIQSQSVKVRDLRSDILNRKRRTDHLKKLIRKKKVDIERKKTEKYEQKLRQLKQQVRNRREAQNDDDESQRHEQSQPQIIYIPVPFYQNYLSSQNPQFASPQNRNHVPQIRAPNHFTHRKQNPNSQPPRDTGYPPRDTGYPPNYINNPPNYPPQAVYPNQQMPPGAQPVFAPQLPTPQNCSSVDEQRGQEDVLNNIDDFEDQDEDQKEINPSYLRNAIQRKIMPPPMDSMAFNKNIIKQKMQMSVDASRSKGSVEYSTLYDDPHRNSVGLTQSIISSNLGSALNLQLAVQSGMRNAQNGMMNDSVPPHIRVNNPANQQEVIIESVTKEETMSNSDRKIGKLENSKNMDGKLDDSNSKVGPIKDSIHRQNDLQKSSEQCRFQRPFNQSQIECVNSPLPRESSDIQSPSKVYKSKKQQNDEVYEKKSQSKYVQLQNGTFTLLGQTMKESEVQSNHSVFFGSLMEVTQQIDQQKLKFTYTHHQKAFMADDLDQIEMPMDSTIARPSKAKDSVIRRSHIINRGAQFVDKQSKEKQIQMHSKYASKINVDLADSQLHEIEEEKESDLKQNLKSEKLKKRAMLKFDLKKRILHKINSLKPENKGKIKFSRNVIENSIIQKTGLSTQQIEPQQLIKMYELYIRQLKKTMGQPQQQQEQSVKLDVKISKVRSDVLKAENNIQVDNKVAEQTKNTATQFLQLPKSIIKQTGSNILESEDNIQVDNKGAEQMTNTATEFVKPDIYKSKLGESNDEAADSFEIDNTAAEHTLNTTQSKYIRPNKKGSNINVNKIKQKMALNIDDDESRVFMAIESQSKNLNRLDSDQF